jgi:hypothetical protein
MAKPNNVIVGDPFYLFEKKIKVEDDSMNVKAEVCFRSHDSIDFRLQVTSLGKNHHCDTTLNGTAGLTSTYQIPGNDGSNQTLDIFSFGGDTVNFEMRIFREHEKGMFLFYNKDCVFSEDNPNDMFDFGHTVCDCSFNVFGSEVLEFKGKVN